MHSEPGNGCFAGLAHDPIHHRELPFSSPFREKLKSYFLLACLADFWLMCACKGLHPVEKMDLEETLKRHLFFKRCCSSTVAALDTVGGQDAAARAAVLPLAPQNGLFYI